MNLKQTTMRRIQLFDGATLKMMILVCSARKLGKTIFIVPEARHWNPMCYTWHNYQNEIHAKKKAIETKAEGSANQYAIVRHTQVVTRKEEQVNPDIAIGHLTHTPSSTVDFSPGDYARWIQMENPELAASPLGWALKEHNAKCVHIVNEMKRNIANENIRFTKKLLKVYSDKPRLVTPAPKQSYFIGQPIRPFGGAGTHNDGAPSRLTTNIVGRRLELSSPSPTTRQRDQPAVMPTADQLSTTPTRCQKRSRIDEAADAPTFDLDIDDDNEASTPIKKDGKGSPLSPTVATKAYSDNLVGQLMMLNDEIGDTEGHIVFGQVNDIPIIKTKVAHTKFTEDPWSTNRTIRTHGELVRKAIRYWMRSRTPLHLSRDWVSHPAPRFIAVSGNAIKSQVCDGAGIDHELGSLIIRRMAQMESHAHRATPDEQYRLLLEPDFSSHAIAGENTTRIMSIQRQFTGVDVKCNISNCRMVTIPAVMQHGWCSFNWDMMHHVITIMDPMAYQTEDANRKTCLMYVAEKLHQALFDCIEEFFTEWHCGRMSWTKKTPLLSTTSFTRQERAMCVIHLIRHFKGNSLAKPLTRAAIANERESIIIEMIHMEGNTASLQLEGLDTVANALNETVSDSGV
ncbi:hypothetical protein ACQJBY_024086 [Aegilops geniculata]